jgi:excisionase family DNA binding protein
VNAADAFVEEVARRAAEIVLSELGSQRGPAEREPMSPYLTIKEAAEYLRCGRQRIDNLLSERRLTRHKDGGRTLVSRAELEAYVAGRPVAPALPHAPRSLSQSGTRTRRPIRNRVAE